RQASALWLKGRALLELLLPLPRSLTSACHLSHHGLRVAKAPSRALLTRQSATHGLPFTVAQIRERATLRYWLPGALAPVAGGSGFITTCILSALASSLTRHSAPSPGSGSHVNLRDGIEMFVPDLALETSSSLMTCLVSPEMIRSRRGSSNSFQPLTPRT